ncbi:vitellogenin-like [Astyanax mexicanus]|uniref:Vitellogenin-like n=1 Tax=Astyanax mexicanus TaxID=7994 RepID=A0A8T2L4B3_ASTMX|nr:vitellogenin-like [Astyanax mexicanus]
MRAVVLALTVALVASQQINLVPEFAAGKTYVYKYEGLLLGGLPQEGLGKAGVKVSSKVLIRAEASTTFLLKLQDPQLFEYAGIWPRDSFSPAAKLLAALNAQLQIPIKFEYANGVLNLKNTQNVYEMHEAGTHGVCKAHYMISEDAKTNQIVVRKSKDLTNCHERVIKDIGLAYAEKCAECQQRLQSLTGTATHTYIMKPSDAGAVVAEATVEELHQFSLFNTITGAAQMKAKYDVFTGAIAPIGGDYAARGSLKYEFATEILQTPIQLLKINNAEAQIVEVLNHLATNNMDVVHEDAPLKFLQLTLKTTAKPRARELMKEAVKALQDGIAFQFAKPLLAAEIRRIIPTAVGVPMELGFYTAAVAAAAVNVKADITPRLPEQLETVTLDQLKKTDFQVKAEARPSAAIHTFAVIGVNTALIQAAVMAKGKVHTAVPGKMAVRADLPKGNFKVEVLPAATPDHVAAVSFETLAVARNIEDLPAERVASLAPAVASGAEPWIPASIQKTLCGTVPYFHVKGCVEVASRHAGFMGYNPLYYLVGQHKASVARGDGPALERLEFEVHVGAHAAEKLTRQNVVESEIQEENIILMKLREILEAGLKNKNSSSSSSSSSRSSRSSRLSRLSQSSSISSSRSASSSSSSSSSQICFCLLQYLMSHERSSSASSIETLQRQLLEDAVPAVLAVIARVVRSDRNVGYQLAAYLDKPTSRAQLVFFPIAEKWKVCADAVLPSQHKVSAKLGWGADCQDYSATVKAEAGVIESNPAARFEVAWDKLPTATEYLPLLKAARLAGFSLDKAENNKDKEVAFIVALPTQKSVNIIVRAPKVSTFY